MREPCSLGRDLGTSSLKAVLVDALGHTRALTHRLYQPRYPQPSWVEIDVEEWERAARDAVRELVRRAEDCVVVGLGIDGQMHGAVFVDPSGNAVRPATLEPDTRAGCELDAWRGLGDDVLRRLANRLFPGMLGPMATWVARHEPGAWGRTAKVLSPKDWLRSRLVPGAYLTDASDASATLLWDAISDDWSGHVLRAAGIDRSLLADLATSSAVPGAVADDEAARWGLPAGTPVAVGWADVATTLLGIDANPGRHTVIVGTGAQALHPKVAPGAAVLLAFHCYRATDGSYYAMAALLNAGLALDWVRQTLTADWDEIYGSLQDRGDTDNLPLFLPFLSGERVPSALPAQSASWRGLGLRTTRGDLFRSALEGVAMSIRRGIESLPTPACPTLDIVGGGSQRAFLQLLADVIRRPVQRISIDSPTAVGAGRLGWIAATGEPSAVHRSTGVELDPAPYPRGETRYAAFLAATFDLVCHRAVGNELPADASPAVVSPMPPRRPS